MGQRLIQQANGLLAVFSDVEDDLIIYDASADEIVEHYAAEAAERAREAARQWVEGRAPGRKTYSVKEAMEWFDRGVLADPDALPEWKQKAREAIEAARAILENTGINTGLDDKCPPKT